MKFSKEALIPNGPTVKLASIQYFDFCERKRRCQVPEQVAFGTNDFANNPEPRCPCVLLLDVSGSMNGQPITLLNQGVQTYKEAIVADSLAAKRVETAVVLFGETVQVANEFCTIDMFNPAPFSAGGNTPMGAAILQAIDMVKRRKDDYKANGIGYFQPWIFLISDGAPTDEWSLAAAQVKKSSDAKELVFFTVGVEGANFDVLRQIAGSREPVRLQGLRFQELFLWLSKSLKQVSRSRPGETVPLPSPQGWASV